MKLPTTEKPEEREAWYRLVVKVILWEEEPVNNKPAETANRISQSEWNIYSQRIIKTNVTYSKERVLLDLQSTFQRIKMHGGLLEE